MFKRVLKLIKSKFTGTSASDTYVPVFTATGKQGQLKPIEEMLQTADAAATYQTLAGMAAYLTSANAAATYQDLAGMAAYLTSAAAALAYEAKHTEKIYKVALNQVGANAPTANIKKNELGEVPVFSYDGVGTYKITFAAPYDHTKVYMYCFANSIGDTTVNITWGLGLDHVIIETYQGGVKTDYLLYESPFYMEVLP